jgi:4-diphosphocytidyl-2-C-methyl-D-erythritol kinase
VNSTAVAAHAKLNVFLRVLGRRDDGLHDIETLILPLELCDAVTVHLGTGESGVRVAVRHEVDGPRAPEGADNLAVLAVSAFADAVGAHRDGVRIEIVKRIPVAAGMGGGSADAAAVLTVLGADRGIEPAALRAIGASVGADVPALVHGGPVFASGAGDTLAPVHAQTTHWVVRPLGVAVTSGEAYGWWDEHPSTGPDTGAIVAAVETGNDDLLGSALFDDLQAGVARRHPLVTDTIDAFLEAGALGAVMTGSGPTVVALARHLGQADVLAAAVPGSFVTSGPPRTMGPLSGVV